MCLYVNVFLFGPRGVLWTAVLLTLKLPLQAAVPMATFHSHLFSIWLWHIHLKIQKHTKWTARCGHVLLKAKFFYYSMWIKTNWFHRLSNIQWLTEEMCEMYMPNHSICVSGGWCWFRGVDVVWVEWIQLSPFLPQCNLAWICPKLLYWINKSISNI